ncbi:MAG: hypothetical protein JSR99_11830 [Proteobacteria bacterium]|nr:hypothetical protein [Pseudomonadota bacterium]
MRTGRVRPQLIEFWRKGLFPFDKLNKFYDIENINDAVYDAESGKVIKPVVKMHRAAR